MRRDPKDETLRWLAQAEEEFKGASTLASNIDRDFGSLKDAKRLDEYYIPTRYPNVLPDGIPARHYDDPEEAERALSLSERVINLVKRKTSL